MDTTSTIALLAAVISAIGTVIALAQAHAANKQAVSAQQSADAAGAQAKAAEAQVSLAVEQLEVAQGQLTLARVTRSQELRAEERLRAVAVMSSGWALVEAVTPIVETQPEWIEEYGLTLPREYDEAARRLRLDITTALSVAETPHLLDALTHLRNYLDQIPQLLWETTQEFRGKLSTPPGLTQSRIRVRANRFPRDLRVLLKDIEFAITSPVDPTARNRCEF